MSFLPPSVEEIVNEWPPELDHISASSLKMAVRCPEQWRQRYIMGKSIPPALAMILGGADHAAIERSMRQKVSSFVDLPTPEVKDAFVEELERRIESDGGIGEIEVTKGSERITDRSAKQKIVDEEKVSGQEVVAAYHTTVSPVFQPTLVEHPFELHPEGLPVKVVGYIDLVAANAQPQLDGETDPVIIDRKRRKAAKRTAEPEWLIQAEIYQLAQSLPFEFHISVCTKTPYVLLPAEDNQLRMNVVARERSEKLLSQIAATIGFYYMRFGPDNPWPAQGKLHPWACGYCGFRPNCWAWA